MSRLHFNNIYFFVATSTAILCPEVSLSLSGGILLTDIETSGTPVKLHHHPLQLLIWTSGHKDAVWTWYDTLGRKCLVDLMKITWQVFGICFSCIIYYSQYQMCMEQVSSFLWVSAVQTFLQINLHLNTDKMKCRLDVGEISEWKSAKRVRKLYHVQFRGGV